MFVVTLSFICSNTCLDYSFFNATSSDLSALIISKTFLMTYYGKVMFILCPYSTLALFEKLVH